jgi:putative flippase GtrA
VVFAAFVLSGLHYAIAAFLATVLGILFNFKTTGSFVFLNRDNRRIFRFFLVYLITYGVTVGLYRLMAMAGVNVLVSAALLALPLALFSYTLLRRLVFNQYP